MMNLKYILYRGTQAERDLMKKQEFIVNLTRKLNRLMLLSQIEFSTKANHAITDDLTHSQVLYLQFVSLLELPTVGQLAEVLGSTASFASRLTTELENLGMVIRVHKIGFRKEVFVQLTEKGIEVVRQVEEFDIQKRIGLLNMVDKNFGIQKVKVIDKIVDHLISLIHGNPLNQNPPAPALRAEFLPRLDNK